jgi:glycosyltransferase involved in cell wall biosynthesis
MMTVSRGIADRYTDRYRIPVEVVTNAPPMASTEPTLVGEPIRMIHHGGAVPERQIERTIEAMDLLGDGYQLDLMLMRGWPDYYRRLEGLVAATPRVQLVQPVSQRAIVQTINAYDIGVYLLPPTNENLRLALPNKLFEFIQARLAIAIGPSVEMARIVRDHQCGVVAEDFTPQSFAAAIAQLTPEKIMGFKRASHAAASTLSAESNREIVLRLVDRVLGR